MRWHTCRKQYRFSVAKFYECIENKSYSVKNLKNKHKYLTYLHDFGVNA